MPLERFRKRLYLKIKDRQLDAGLGTSKKRSLSVLL